MLRLLPLLILASQFVACGASVGRRQSTSEGPASASAIGAESTPFHSLSGWQKTVPYYISSDAPDEVIEASQNAADTWSDSIGQVAMKFMGISLSVRGKELYSTLDDESTFVYYEKNWSATTSKSSTTLATTIWENAGDSDRIVRGDVILNAQSYTFLDALSPIPLGVEEYRVVDAETVLLHEFGHLLGLDHVDEEDDEDSIMHAKTFIGPGLSFRSVGDADIKNIRMLYH